MNEVRLLLQQWVNFYASMSQAAGALIGLLFVVITIAAERRPNDIAKIRVYLTPTVIYFASVLCIAELLTIPNHTRLTATFCMCVTGIAGSVYSASLCFGRGGGKRHDFYEHTDLIVYAVVPCAAYGLLIWGGALLLHDAERGLTIVAVVMLSLLALAIRNSWAIVVDLVSGRPG